MIMNIGAYQKDKLWVPPADLEEKANPYMNWETVNPMWWCPRGYACVRVDTRGSGKSPGKSDPSSYQEGARLLRRHRMDRETRRGVPATSARSGISYHASSQWRRRQPAAAVAEGDHARGKDAPTSTATRPTTAAFSRWASSATGG